ncbi:MAG: radical SAM protein [Nitrospirae bacterium]|nr:radical SAM protein [Nitrospirota bacterium]
MKKKLLEKLKRIREVNPFSLSGFNYCYSRLLQELAYFTDSSFGRPTSAIILLTNRCNARCLHCHSWKLPPVEEMTTVEWKKTFHELRRWLGPVFISITGGETLLKKDAIEIVEYAANLGFWVEFLTNGYLMDEDKAGRLAQSGVKRIKISLDGSRSEIHDNIRGRKGFFEKATYALQTLAQKRDKWNKGLKVWAKTSIMSLNVEDLPNIVVLARDLQIDGVEFQALEPVYYSKQLGDPNWYKDNPLWITDLSALSFNIQKLKDLKERGYPVLNSFENLDLIENYFNDPDRLSFKVHSHDYEKKKNECRSWLGGLQIMPYGGIKMCHWMKPFANVRNRKINNAWENRQRCRKDSSLCAYLNKDLREFNFEEG